MRPPGWFRLMRSGLFASVCVVLSLAGHDLMTPHPAPAWAGWTALAGLTAVGHCLADRRRPAWWLLLAVEMVQGFLHLWFTWSAHLGHPVTAVPGAAHHGGAGTPVPMDHGGASPGMLGAHALAGALVALWLYAGERALWRTLDAVAGFLLRPVLWTFAVLFGGGLPGEARAPRIGGGRGEDERPPNVAVLCHTLVRRGPPRPVGVAVDALI
ncbi:hypothetical protein [Actinomadura kijaniata]|uniref:hypothetical protein n=1 Tax=Actinomadura kijaniata TaxID=46161 RepID=UPI000A5E7EDB|nr:hypothetical protein [Actinomadura kijaniata]